MPAIQESAPAGGGGGGVSEAEAQALVDAGVANVIDGAPGALNTLNELAAALGDDADFAATIVASIATKAPLPAYSAYVPTIAQNGARTTSALTARYMQIGKLVHAWGKATLSNAGTAGNTITVSLPVAPSASFGTLESAIGEGFVADQGTAWMPVLCFSAGGSTVGFVKTNADAEGWVGNSNPSFALASGDRLGWNVVYEAA